jgi:hypothetical protein
MYFKFISIIKPTNAELNPICRLLALLGAHYILHVSRIRANLYMLRAGLLLIIRRYYSVCTATDILYVMRLC